MGSKTTLRWTIARQDGETRILAEGPLTELVDFEQLDLAALPDPLVFDLSGVTRINSFGVRAWMTFVQGLDRVGRQMILERCPPAIVGQLNLVSNFLGVRGAVRSVLAPYYCSKCDADHLDLIDIQTTSVVPLTQPCPDCSTPMEFDDLSEIYLAFRTEL